MDILIKNMDTFKLIFRSRSNSMNNHMTPTFHRKEQKVSGVDDRGRKDCKHSGSDPKLKHISPGNSEHHLSPFKMEYYRKRALR